MIKVFRRFFISVLISLLIAIFVTVIYANTPPFYINSYNFSVVPKLEQNDQNFNYNGFYQSEVSKNIVGSLQLFAATNDFKKTVSSALDENIVFLLSRTHGSSIVNVQLVTLKPLPENAAEVVISKLTSALVSTTPQDLEYTINTLNDFSHSYRAGISNTKFFTIVFTVSLIIVSLFILLNSYYKDE